MTNPKLVIHSRVTDIVSAGVYWWTMECEGDTVAHSIGEFTQAEIENFVKWLSTDLGILTNTLRMITCSLSRVANTTKTIQHLGQEVWVDSN